MVFNKKNIGKFCCIIVIMFSLNFIAAQSAFTSYTQSANYRTALRCLQLSKSFLLRNEWDNASSQAKLGLAYDDSISDLWYICAESCYKTGGQPGQVIPLVVSAMESDNWVDGYYDSARLLYARMLCDTADPASAIEQLDKAPFLFSAEAEFIRIQSYYRLNTEESYAQARERVASAVRLFPEDNRFPNVFFFYELKPDLSYDSQIAPLAKTLVQQYSDQQDAPAEVFIYAAAFAEGELQKRMLRAFDAAGLRNPLYAPLALKAEILSEEEAFRYFCSFAENSMSLHELVRFASLLKDNSVKEALKIFLSAYNGVVNNDISGDGCTDMIINYSRGRPQIVTYDWNQDGLVELEAFCDYGVPTKISFPQEGITLSYKRYPFVATADVSATKYTMVAEALEWTPLTIYSYAPVAEVLDGYQFFVPEPKNYSAKGISSTELLNAASSVLVATNERNSGTVRFTVLSGVFRQAQYFTDGILYAQMTFDSGLPFTRIVDADGDGFFELVENYSPLESEDVAVFDSSLYDSIFGSIEFSKPVYLSSVEVDLDKDTKPDYREEYDMQGGSLYTWGISDENWSAKYINYAGIQNSQAQFHLPVTNEVVVVFIEQNIPVRVTVQDDNGIVIRDLPVISVEGVYWLGNKGSEEASGQLKKILDRDGRQGVCLIDQVSSEEAVDKNKRFTAVRINGFYFGVLLDE
ncbi:MAG: hypothetical protein J6B81_04225 [Spirochaetaceae bacterium]|nr:hypothetical protein [Spirochaetaceae bacterium]